MVSKAFIHQAIYTVYKDILSEDSSDSNRLAAEVRQLATDASIFTPEEISDNEQELNDIERAIEYNYPVCYVDGGVDYHYTEEDVRMRAAAGCTIYHKGKYLAVDAIELPVSYDDGTISAHAAEYEGLIHCLDTLLEFYAYPELVTVTVYSDSKNMVEQINRESRVRQPLLRHLHEEAQGKIDAFHSVNLSYVSREKNAETDALVTQKLKTLPFKSV